MTIQDRFLRLPVLTVAMVFLLAGCGDKPETMLVSARDYLAKNDPKAAVIQLKNALQKDPGSAEARFLLGKALFQSGDPAGAEVELRKALDAKYSVDEVVPLLAQTLLMTAQAKKLLSDLTKVELTTTEAKADLQTSVAIAQAVTGEKDKARESIDAALKVKPDHVRAMIAKARLMLANQEVAGALGVLESALARDSKNYEAWNLIGDIRTFQGNGDAALSAYRKALEAKPDFATAHSAIFAALMKANKFDEAGAQLEAMKKVLPKNRQTLLVEAEYLYQKKDFKRALEVTQQLLKIAPDSAKVLFLAGAVHFQLNSLAQAEDALARSLKQSPGAIPTRRLLAITYLRMGQPARALATIEPVLAQSDKDSALLSLAGDVYMQNGDPQKAGEYFARAAALDPQNAGKQTKLALTHLMEGKGEAALTELEDIAATDTGTTADMALIATSIRGGEYGKALKAIDVLEKKLPDGPLVHTLRGSVLAAKGDVSAGRKSFEKALALKPAFYPAAAGLANLDLKDHKPADAKKRFENVLAVDPKNVQAGLALAELQAHMGDAASEVLAQISKTIQANPSEPAPRLMLIGFHLQNKDPKKAVTAAQDAAAVLPDRIDIIDALGRAQQASGDTNQALATTGKLISLMPGAPLPYLRMAEINVAANNKEAAIQDLRKALDLTPDLVVAQRGLILLYLDSRKFEDAQRIAADIKKQRPTEAVGYLLDGDIAASRKAWIEALSAYRAGLKAVPATELAVKVHAVLLATNKTDEAEKFASRWFTDHPKDAGFRLAVAESATARRDYPTAVRHYQALLQSQPDNPIILNNVAWALGQLKDPKALDYSERANRIAPNQPAIMETLGSLLADKGDVTRALEVLQKAMELAPQSPALKLSLARVQIKAGKKSEARKQLDELAKLGDKFSAQAEVAKLAKEAAN